MGGSWSRYTGPILLACAFLGILLLVASGFRTQGGAWAVALVSLLLFGVAVYLVGSRRRQELEEAEDAEAGSDRRYLFTLMAVALAMRLLIGFAVHPGGSYASYLGPDELTFDENGWQFALWLDEQTHPSLRLSHRYLDSLQVGYFYLIGVLYYMFGHHLLVPVVLNCIIGTVTILPAYAIARELLDRRAGRYAAFFIAFFPSLVLWSTLVIRDMLVILVLMLILLVVMRLKRRFSIPGVLWLCLLMAVLGTLRQYLFLIAGLSVGVSFLIVGSGRLGRSLTMAILVVIGLVFLVKVIGFGQTELSRASLEALAQHRRWNAYEAAGASFHADIDISTPTNALTYLPTGMMWFLFAPFPWQMAGTRQLLALPDVLIWYVLFPYTMIGLGHLVRRRFVDVSALLVFVIALTVLYSLVEGNVGIIFRHRAQILAPLLCCAGVGISLRKRKREEEREKAGGRTEETTLALERAGGS
jgi:hypothetical protein